MILKNCKEPDTSDVKIVANAENGESQILYLALQDANSTTDNPQTLVHIVDDHHEPEISIIEESANVEMVDSLESPLFSHLPIQEETDISLGELQIQVIVLQCFLYRSVNFFSL